jgi:endogenous inhibitor of DNA gyrase (YacG/DUF329 family)
MVEIQCPHCGGEVELENNISGTFQCPHCENDFEWEDKSFDVVDGFLTSIDFSIGFFSPITVILVFGFLGLISDFPVISLCGMWLSPIAAIALGVYGYTNERKSLAIGATLYCGSILISFFTLWILWS